MMPSFWRVKISQLGGTSLSVSVLSVWVKCTCSFTNKSCTHKERTQVWENNHFNCEGLKLPHTVTVFCVRLHLSGDMASAQGPCGRDPRVRQQQMSMNTVWWQWLTARRLRALHGGLLPSATHWVSWRCLPWLSSSCSGLAEPCHVPLFAHWWVDHIALLWQTAEPRWKNAWTAPRHPSPSRARYRALSSHPDNRLHLPHQKHSLPGRHKWRQR